MFLPILSDHFKISYIPTQSQSNHIKPIRTNLDLSSMLIRMSVITPGISGSTQPSTFLAGMSITFSAAQSPDSGEEISLISLT